MLILFSVLTKRSFAVPSLLDYTNYPVFITQSATPNVLIILDNSGSMTSDAYMGDYDSDTRYYGYFNPALWYKYTNNKFVETETDTPRFKGNVLNWATMRRVDVARKVLIGGKAVSRIGNGRKTLIGESRGSWGALKFNSDAEDIVVEPAAEDYWFILTTKGKFMALYWGEPYVGAGYEVWNTDTYTIKVDVAHEDTIGIIQNTEGKVRYGLEFFNTSHGGKIVIRVGNSQGNSIVTAIQNKSPGTWTPLAEAFYEGCRYFQQVTPYYFRGDFTRNNTWDPYYDNDDANFIPCAKSFVVLITDGESTQDRTIPDRLKNYDGDKSEINRSYSSYGSDYLDDIALWAHTTDLREDLDGFQNVTLYTVFAFGSGSELLKDAAINGGFIDMNNDKIPDTAEWDGDGDTLPDTYFAAENGYALESALAKAINNILKRATSGTAVSVLSTSNRGEGAIYQAYFLPSKPEGMSEVKWLGYLQCLWVDPFSNLREDTDRDRHLVYTNDKIVRFEFDEASNETKIKRYLDSDGDGLADDNQDPETVTFGGITSIWEAGSKLANMDPDNRDIFTFIDVDESMKPPLNDYNEEVIKFDTANTSSLRPYLGVVSDDEAEKIIQYIRGVDMEGYRSRTVTVGSDQKVWKLGDIVYSTPAPVGPLQSNYDLIYSDRSYKAFISSERYQNREIVIYVGANDGMLHAFTNGRFYSSDDPNTDDIDHGWFTEVDGTPLGTELWAYIPYAVLPHLKWLTREDYTHVFYVDLKPKILDVRIFHGENDDEKYPDGWGTVLIGGMRFGGGKISLTDDFGRGDETRTFRSEYFILDITEPREPKLIMRFESPEMGFSLSYPAVAKVGDIWYIIFGSGPENDYPPDYMGSSSQRGILYIWDMTNRRMHTRRLNETNAFLGSPVIIDTDLNISQTSENTYSTELGYIGESYFQGNRWKGAIYRFMMKEEQDPALWALSPVIISGLNTPVVATPATTKSSRGEIWVYFGTGKMFSEMDRSNSDTEYFIGFKEPCSDFSSFSSCSSELAVNDFLDMTDARVIREADGTVEVRGTSGGSHNMNYFINDSVKGWKVGLPLAGEKVLSKATVIGGLVLFTSYIPDSSPCSFGGSGKLYSIYYETGTAYEESTIGEEAVDDGTMILRSTSLGKGTPSTTSVHIGTREQSKSFIQTSTGTIVEIDTTTPSSFKSGLIYWRKN